MAYKPFDQALHDKNDPPARAAVTEWVKVAWGLTCIENPDKYAVDLIVYRNDQICGYIEVEVRNWGQKHCPHSSIHIAQRKTKLFSNVRATLIFVVTRDFENAYWCKAEDVKLSPLIEVPNRSVASGEYFYDVPIELFKYVYLDQPF